MGNYKPVELPSWDKHPSPSRVPRVMSDPLQTRAAWWIQLQCFPHNSKWFFFWTVHQTLWMLTLVSESLFATSLEPWQICRKLAPDNFKFMDFCLVIPLNFLGFPICAQLYFVEMEMDFLESSTVWLRKNHVYVGRVRLWLNIGWNSQRIHQANFFPLLWANFFSLLWEFSIPQLNSHQYHNGPTPNSSVMFTTPNIRK